MCCKGTFEALGFFVINLSLFDLTSEMVYCCQRSKRADRKHFHCELATKSQKNRRCRSTDSRFRANCLTYSCLGLNWPVAALGSLEGWRTVLGVVSRLHFVGWHLLSWGTFWTLSCLSSKCSQARTKCSWTFSLVPSPKTLSSLYRVCRRVALSCSPFKLGTGRLFLWPFFCSCRRS